MRTRAMASLRRPVPSALPVTTGRRVAARSARESLVEVVYSDTDSPAGLVPAVGSIPAVGSVPAAAGASVGSATLSSSCFLISSCCFARCLLGGGPADLLDLRDLEWDRLLRLVRVLRAGVDLELAQHLPAQRVLREHAPDGLLDRTLGALGHQLAVGHGPQATRVAGVPVGLLVL